MGQWHDDVCKELAHLCSMALMPSRISSEPGIFHGRELNAAQRTEGEVLGDEARGDVGAHGFWKRGRTTIFDIMICDMDAKSYRDHTLKKVLESTALRKKNSKTTSPFAMGCAQGDFLNAAMDATNPSRWSTGSAVRRAVLWDSGMTTYAKNCDRQVTHLFLITQNTCCFEGKRSISTLI